MYIYLIFHEDECNPIVVYSNSKNVTKYLSANDDSFRIVKMTIGKNRADFREIYTRTEWLNNHL